MTCPTSTEDAAAATGPSAVVIPFPAARKAAPDPQMRLARALESLEAALANQRAAIAAWRDVLKDLKSTTANLDASLQGYRNSLRSLGGSVSALQAKARTLEEWADKASQADCPKD